MGLKKIRGGFGLWVLLGLVCSASAQTSWKPVEKIMGRSGEVRGPSLEFLWPRTDLNVLVQGTPLEPGLALAHWVTFQSLGSQALLRGQLLLLSSEVEKAIAQLEDQNFKVTSLGSPFLNESPPIRTVYFEAQGRKADLARSLKWILKILGLGVGPVNLPQSGTPALPDWTAVEKILGPGEPEEGHLQYVIPRKGPLLVEGLAADSNLATATVFYFQKSGAQTLGAGSFVLEAGEVQGVLAVLLAHHIQATGAQNLWMGESPGLFSVHFWAQGDGGDIAAGLKAALEESPPKNP